MVGVLLTKLFIHITIEVNVIKKIIGDSKTIKGYKKMSEVILVVDDDTSNLMLAKKILGTDFRIAAANSGEAACRYLENNKPDLVLVDINMPEMDGFELVAKMKENPQWRSISVIFLTADKDEETEVRCFQAGAVDFVGKPFMPEILNSRVKRTLELERYRNSLEKMVEEQAEQLTGALRRISEIQQHVIVGMANLIESRDGSTGKHVKNTQTYVRMIAEELQRRGLFADILTREYIEKLCKAAPLHDVGKIQVPDSILQKPGKLTDEEYSRMKDHTSCSAAILDEIIGDVEEEEYIQLAKDVATCHHERWDGKGYPKGLSGEQIPLAARIMALADVFDALYEERCYKPAIRPIEKIYGILEEGKGTQFDPVITDVFLSLDPQLREHLANRGW